MPQKRRPRPYKNQLPDPLATLRNLARFQGEPAPLPPAIRTVRGGYRAAGTDLSEVQGIIDWDTHQTHFMLGHYNPARQKWQIFPECVPDKQQARALATEMSYTLPPLRRQALASAQQGNSSFVDLHDPATHKVRMAVEKQLAPLHPMEFVQNKGVLAALNHGDILHDTKASPVVGTDEHTFCFPTLGIRTIASNDIEHIEFRPDSLLTLCYNGLIVQSPHHHGRRRAIRHVPVAYGHPDLGWTRNVDTVTPDQWRILQPIASTLIAMAQEVPRFSPLFCAIAYGPPDPQSLQWRM